VKDLSQSTQFNYWRERRRKRRRSWTSIRKVRTTHSSCVESKTEQRGAHCASPAHFSGIIKIERTWLVCTLYCCGWGDSNCVWWVHQFCVFPVLPPFVLWHVSLSYAFHFRSHQ